MARAVGKVLRVRQIAVRPATATVEGDLRPEADEDPPRPRAESGPQEPTPVASRATWLPTVEQLPPDERPRERLIEFGASVLRTSELIAIVLGSGIRGQPVTRLAESLLREFSGLGGLGRAPISELCRVQGIGTEIGRASCRERV